MRRTPIVFALTCAVLAAAAAHAQERRDVRITVRVPDGTPGDAAVYIAGNHERMGPWNPGLMRMEKAGPGHYQVTLDLARGFTLQYKYTRGGWDTVEKDDEGREVANREVVVDGDSPILIEDTVASWADPDAADAGRPAREPTMTGHIQVHEGFASEALGNRRTISVYLPPDYEGSPGRRYPVLYMHDGQNVFDAARSAMGVEWEADETAEALIRAGRIEPIIIVAIDNTEDRMSELTATVDPKWDAGGKAPRYASFLVGELKPFIDRTYRTRPDRANTAVAGSSLGGLVSLYLVEQHPEVFSRCGAMSPALQWNRDHLLDRWAGAGDKAWMRGVRFWVDTGTAEGNVGKAQVAGAEEWKSPGWVARCRKLARALNDAGLVWGRDFYYYEDFGAIHQEGAWARRLPWMLEFMFAADPGDAPAQ